MRQIQQVPAWENPQSRQGLTKFNKSFALFGRLTPRYLIAGPDRSYEHLYQYGTSPTKTGHSPLQCSNKERRAIQDRPSAECTRPRGDSSPIEMADPRELAVILPGLYPPLSLRRTASNS